MTEATDAKSVLENTKKKMGKAVDATRREFQNMRTGRASIALVEGLQVDYYNTPTPLKQISNISTPDAKTIAITPWEPNVIGDIERAVMKSDLGLTPVNDGKVIRLQIPPLTDERRSDLSKVLKKVAEEGRVSIRASRHDGVEQVKKLEKGKEITEDDSRSYQKEIQKMTDTYVGQVDEALKVKDAEIHGI